MHNNVIKIVIIGICIFLFGGMCVSGVRVDGVLFNDQSVHDHILEHAVSQASADEIVSHAEYDQVTELIISWPRVYSYGSDEEPYFVDIIRAAEQAVSVRINVNNFFYKYRILSLLEDEQIPVDNITISTVVTNSIWVRDYGPFFIEKNGGLAIVDFNYYGHKFRLLDDLYPTFYGLQNKVDFDFRANFALCIQGGNYMSDGHGLAMITEYPLVVDNPSKTLDDMIVILKQYLGLDEVVILQSQVDDGTGHIDMFSKLLDMDTVLVGQWDDVNDSNYQILEDNAQVLVDKGYTVVRVPMLRDSDPEKDTIWTYTNSLIINGTHKKIVLVPQYDTPEDAVAISIYAAAMPDYEIIGVNSRLVIDYLGAIHCTTITVPYIDNIRNNVFL